MKQIVIIGAKYSKNVTALYTLDQLANMFKSKFKYMKEDLMYMQTLVGAHHAAEHMIKIDIDLVKIEESEIYEKAKLEAGIIVGEIKITDPEYYQEK